MTPRRRAVKLIRYFMLEDRNMRAKAIECALVHCERTKDLLEEYADLGMLTNWGNAINYWNEVMAELRDLKEDLNISRSSLLEN